MITKEFINTYSGVTRVQQNISSGNDKGSILKSLQKKHCLFSDNRHTHIVAFVQAAKAVGVDAFMVENYIHNNISIARDSSKSDLQNLKVTIADLYKRYPVANTTTTTSKREIAYNVNYNDQDYNTLFKKYDLYRVTTESNYPIPEPIISINGESIATYGNIMAISGVQKSGKSSLCNIILSGTISSELDGVPNELKIKSSEGKAIIHIDTEQAKHHHLKNLRYSVLKRSNKEFIPDFFYSYNVRGMEMQIAIDMLNFVFFMANKNHGGIHIVLIDGIADFIGSVNDEEQSNAIVKLLEYLATYYNTLVIVVIHRNPNDGKVRGHLGSQLLRKCEAILAVKKEGDNSYIDPEELRTAAKGDIPKYLFAYNKEKGYHTYIGEQKNEAKMDKQQLLQNFVNNNMQTEKEYPRKELITMLCKNMVVEEDMADKYIARMRDTRLIVSIKRGFWIKVVEDLFTGTSVSPFDEGEV